MMVPTSNGIHNRPTRLGRKRNDANCYPFTLFLTHVGHATNVRKQPASLRSDSGPHHRNQRPTSPEYTLIKDGETQKGDAGDSAQAIKLYEELLRERPDS